MHSAANATRAFWGLEGSLTKTYTRIIYQIFGISQYKLQEFYNYSVPILKLKTNFKVSKKIFFEVALGEALGTVDTTEMHVMPMRPFMGEAQNVCLASVDRAD